MSGNLIANRYAKALLNVVGNANEAADKMAEFLSEAAKLFEVMEFKKVLTSPVMPGSIKREILAYVAERLAVGKEGEPFIQGIVEAGRVNLVPEISSAYRSLLDERRGVAHAVVTTVAALSEADKKALQDTLAGVFKKNLSVDNKVNPKILGGLVVEVGNFALDLSVKARLSQLAEHAQE